MKSNNSINIMGIFATTKGFIKQVLNSSSIRKITSKYMNKRITKKIILLDKFQCSSWDILEILLYLSSIVSEIWFSMHLYRDYFFNQGFIQTHILPLFLTFSSSWTNFTPISNNLVTSSFSIISKMILKLFQMCITRKMKVLNSLFEWKAIMIVWMKLHCDWTNRIRFMRPISRPEIFWHFSFKIKIWCRKRKFLSYKPAFTISKVSWEFLI